METQNNKFVVWIVAMLIVGFVAGVFLDPYLPSSLSNAKKGYQTGFVAARTLAENSAVGSFFKTPDDVRSVSGLVTAIDSDRVSISISSSNPFEDQTLNDRVVFVTADTKIIKLTLGKTEGTTSIQSFVPTATDISALKVGDSLLVTATENVKSLKEFTANEIDIQPAHTK